MNPIGPTFAVCSRPIHWCELQAVGCGIRGYAYQESFINHVTATVPLAQSACYAVATRTDFLVRCVVRRRRAFRGLKPRPIGEIGRNVHAHSFRFPRTRFFACQPKDAHQNLGRGNRTRRLTSVSSDVSDFLGRHLGRGKL